MTEQSKQPQNPPAEHSKPEVYAVSQDEDGTFHFTRRGFAILSAAAGGTLLLRGVCPRFAAKPAPGESGQAAMRTGSGVHLHTEPSIASNITGTLQNDDLVRLISDHPDLGWVQVATRNGQQGWVKSSFVDFSRLVRSRSPNFDLSSTPTPIPTETAQPRTLSARLRDGDRAPDRTDAAGRPCPCGNAIKNGDFESGSDPWVEETDGTIIRNDWPDPYRGDYVAWMGGLDAVERLTQLFHVPADVQDAQTFEFYVQVKTEETGAQVMDTLIVRFLNAGGSPISPDIAIVDNLSQSGWLHATIDLDEMTEYADLDIQVQFEASVNATNITSFVIDLVSLDMICEEVVYYAYLPIVLRAPTPTSTNTPTATPTPSATPCPNHSSCSCDVDSGCSCDADGGCGCHSYSSCSCESDVPCVCDTYQACTCVGHYCSCEYYYW